MDQDKLFWPVTPTNYITLRRTAPRSVLSQQRRSGLNVASGGFIDVEL